MEDILEVLDHYRVEYRTEGDRHCRPGWVQLQCPWCQSGKWHLGINLSSKGVSCYACGKHSLYEVLLTVCRLTKAEAYKRSKSLNAGFSPSERVKPHFGRFKPPNGRIELAKAHRNYLVSRRFDPAEVVSLWKIQGIGLATKLSWRLYIPVILDGKEVSWTTRSISKTSSMPYISASAEEESVPAKSILYGEDYAGDRVAIHEGPLDVWSTGPGALGTLGIGYTPSQMLRMTRYRKRYIAFDNEPKAQERARQLANELRPFPGSTYVVEIDAKDMNEASERERRKFRRAVFGKGG